MVLTNCYVLVSYYSQQTIKQRGTCCDGTKSRRHEACTNCDKCRNENSFEPGVSATTKHSTECRLIRHVKTWQGTNPVSLMSLHGRRLQCNDVVCTTDTTMYHKSNTHRFCPTLLNCSFAEKFHSVKQLNVFLNFLSSQNYIVI